MSGIVVGIDLGGTASRFIVYDDRQVLASAVHSTDNLAAGTVDERLDRLAAVIADIAQLHGAIQAIGIGASGPVDIRTGTIHNPHTLPGFSGFSLTNGLMKRLSVPAMIDNDAVTAAIAEQHIGTGVGAERLLVVTLGTGIGVAFLYAGTPFRGPSASHPEGGHIPIRSGQGRCYCGATGCWEQAASRKSLQEALRPLLAANIPDKDVVAAAAQKKEDPTVRAIFARFGTAVGEGLAVLHTLYVPETTVIAGSAAKYFQHYETPLRIQLLRKAEFRVEPRILPTILGDNAGAIGAAVMVQQCR